MYFALILFLFNSVFCLMGFDIFFCNLLLLSWQYLAYSYAKYYLENKERLQNTLDIYVYEKKCKKINMKKLFIGMSEDGARLSV